MTAKAAAVYNKAGLPDNAAYLLERSSKILEDRRPDLAIQMLEKAAEIVETENRPIQVSNY